MQEGAADVDIVLPAHEQRGGAGIDGDSDPGDHHHGFALDRGGFGHAVKGLEQDRADRHQQQSGIGQRGKDGRALVAIGKALRCRALRRDACSPGKQQGEDVGKIVARIGDQRHRARDPSIRDFDDDECGVEDDADQEGIAEIRGRMAVRVAMPVPVIMRMAVTRSHRAIDRRRNRARHGRPHRCARKWYCRDVQATRAGS